MSYEKRKEINIRFVLPLHWIKTFYVQLNIKTDLFVTEYPDDWYLKQKTLI